MISPKITILLGVFYVFIGIIKGFGIPIHSSSIALFSITAACFSFLEFFNEVKSKRMFIKITEVGTGLTFICCLLSLTFASWFELFKAYITPIGDVATIVGFGIFFVTVGNKEIKFLQNRLQKKTISRVDFAIVSSMVNQEYTIFLDINKSVEQLKKIDFKTLYFNRVHDGWGQFHDSFLDYEDIGPFYDSYNNRLFRKFIDQVSIVANTINTISNPDTIKLVAKVTIWGDIVDITSAAILNYTVGPNLHTVEERLKEALDTWNELKNEVTERQQND